MKRIGITGQTGFIGTNLYNTLGLYPEDFKRIPFNREIFDDETSLDAFVSKCDVIIHLAAVNRHNDPYAHETNIELTSKLILSLERTCSLPLIIFSSSIQEKNDNLFAKSKKEGRISLEEWAKRNGGSYVGLIIPNVFGPFGKPFHNSVVATFCYQLTHGQTPKIEVDGNLKLIYVGEIISEIISIIRIEKLQEELNLYITETREIKHTHELKVSELLTLLSDYKQLYFDKGIIPSIESIFERNLFNTFRSYMSVHDYYPVRFSTHTDNRGLFAELARLGTSGQVSFSTTRKGITRGNHFHTRKIERFAVIKGKALIHLRRIGTEEVISFYIDGDEPAYVDMPVWYTHNITNTGDEDLYTIFWINEWYDPEDPDTWMEKV